MGLRPAKSHEKLVLQDLWGGPPRVPGSAPRGPRPGGCVFSTLLGWAFRPRNFMKNRCLRWGMLQLASRPEAGRAGGFSPLSRLFHRNDHTLLAGDAPDSDHDGLVAGRDIGRDHHVQLHDAGHKSGGFPGEGPLGRLAADHDGGLQQRRAWRAAAAAARGSTAPVATPPWSLSP